jgi:hypothetical protein
MRVVARVEADLPDERTTLPPGDRVVATYRSDRVLDTAVGGSLQADGELAARYVVDGEHVAKGLISRAAVRKVGRDKAANSTWRYLCPVTRTLRSHM